MMRWKTTAALVAFTIGLGAYIALYEIKQPAPDEREQLARQILRVQPQEVTQIAFDLPQIAQYTLTRTPEGTWRLWSPPSKPGAPHRPPDGGRHPAPPEEAGSRVAGSPLDARANAAQINHLLTSLDPLIAQRTLRPTPDQPLDPTAYGLKPPEGQLTLTAGGAPITLVFGQATAVGDNRYLQLSGRPELFVVSSALFTAANRPPDHWRDPFLMQADPWSAEELRITSGAQTVELRRADGRWRLVQPVDDQAEGSEIQALFNRLSGLKAARFLSEQPTEEQAATWGFDQPTMQATVRLDEPSRTYTLTVGKPLADEASLAYARRDDEPFLYAVKADEVQALLGDPARLRAASCFEGLSGDVVKVEWSMEGRSQTIERVDAQWRDLASGTGLERARVEEWLNRLFELRAVAFLDPLPPEAVSAAGLQPPQGTITVWTGGSDQPQRLLVGSTRPDSETRYGRLDARQATVALPAAVTDVLATSPESFRQPPPDTTAPPAATTAAPAGA